MDHSHRLKTKKSRLGLLIFLLLCLGKCGGTGGEPAKDDTTPSQKKKTIPNRPVKVKSILDCPNGTSFTYENFGEPFMLNYCTSCHSKALTGEERAGAPEEINLDSSEDMNLWLMMIFDAAADSSVSPMPPMNNVPSWEREELAEWLNCGAPGDTESL